MSLKEKGHGDFTGLARNYSRYRPGYSGTVLTALLNIVGKPTCEIDFVDVGAGTGIWTRMVANRGCRSVIAVEPNDDMRTHGEQDNGSCVISWRKGSAEHVGLPDGSCDLLTMASSFHWADFSRATREFARVLRKTGRFAALWNPRYIESNPLLLEIENKLYQLAPNIKRVSSGRSGITEVLTQKLYECRLFDDVIYIEGRHTVRQTPEEYIGVWWSVNDIQVQAGEEAFRKFMQYVTERVSDIEYIETTYLTRAWSAQKV